jgi:hypothetical protein
VSGQTWKVRREKRGEAKKRTGETFPLALKFTPFYTAEVKTQREIEEHTNIIIVLEHYY